MSKIEADYQLHVMAGKFISFLVEYVGSRLITKREVTAHKCDNEMPNSEKSTTVREASNHTATAKEMPFSSMFAVTHDYSRAWSLELELRVYGAGPRP
jgi:hypothetical protein